MIRYELKYGFYRVEDRKNDFLEKLVFINEKYSLGLKLVSGDEDETLILTLEEKSLGRMSKNGILLIDYNHGDDDKRFIPLKNLEEIADCYPKLDEINILWRRKESGLYERVRDVSII
ncbi:MAG: hypothetical protein OQK82_08400 [Candidatus Pacearchaeota archaeon]|nr:hypothetical protein [Candidatus Pacearchaeota archaeon]